MKKFQDKENGQWTIDLSVGTLRRVKRDSDGKFNLFEPEADHDGVPLRQALWADDAEFWEVLYQIVEPDATKREITADKFGELMAAKCLASAKLVFFDEWRDFFRDLQRPDKAAALEKMAQYQGKALELVTAELRDPQMGELDKQVEVEMQSRVKTLFGGLRASLASQTPTHEPGGS